MTYRVRCVRWVRCSAYPPRVRHIHVKKYTETMWTLPHYTTQTICIILFAVLQWMMNLKSMVPSLPNHTKWTEVKLVPCHDDIWGSGKTAQHILTTPLAARRGGQLHIQKSLPYARCTWYPLKRILRGLKPIWTLWNSLTLAKKQPIIPQTSSL
jgi:hypothetical protein